MTTVRFESTGGRLRIEGDCHADHGSLEEAFAAFANLAGGHLIVDLTAVGVLDRSVADDLLAAATRSRNEGGSVVFVRKHGTAVDTVLTLAEEAARPSLTGRPAPSGRRHGGFRPRSGPIWA